MELPPDAELSGEDMPEIKSYMQDKQKNGDDFDAAEIFEETWTWIRERGCDKLVSVQLVRNYAMSVSRWIQCEHAISLCIDEPELHETGQQPLVSDFPDREGKLLGGIYGSNATG